MTDISLHIYILFITIFMSIIFNFKMWIFIYFIIYSFFKYFHEFLIIFTLYIFVKISIDISNISVKFKYWYIHIYRYFKPSWVVKLENESSRDLSSKISLKIKPKGPTKY